MHQKVEELVSLKQYGGEFGDRLDVVIEAWERARARLGSELIAMTRLISMPKSRNSRRVWIPKPQRLSVLHLRALLAWLI